MPPDVLRQGEALISVLWAEMQGPGVHFELQFILAI